MLFRSKWQEIGPRVAPKSCYFCYFCYFQPRRQFAWPELRARERSTAAKSGEFPKLDDEYPSPHPLVLLVSLLVSDKPWSVDDVDEIVETIAYAEGTGLWGA